MHLLANHNSIASQKMQNEIMQRIAKWLGNWTVFDKSPQSSFSYVRLRDVNFKSYQVYASVAGKMFIDDARLDWKKLIFSDIVVPAILMQDFYESAKCELAQIFLKDAELEGNTNIEQSYLDIYTHWQISFPMAGTLNLIFPYQLWASLGGVFMCVSKNANLLSLRTDAFKTKNCKLNIQFELDQFSVNELSSLQVGSMLRSKKSATNRFELAVNNKPITDVAIGKIYNFKAVMVIGKQK